MVASKSKITLADGKSYALVRLKGNSKEARESIWGFETNKSAPEHNDLINAGISETSYDYFDSSMGHWFCREADADRTYLYENALNHDADVFVIRAKAGYSIAFFSLQRSNSGKYISLGAAYVKKNFRGLMGLSKNDPRAFKGRFKGTGVRIIETAINIARKMGYTRLNIPSMSYGMQSAVKRATRNPELKKRLSEIEIISDHGESLSGPDANLSLYRRKRKKVVRREARIAAHRSTPRIRKLPR